MSSGQVIQLLNGMTFAGSEAINPLIILGRLWLDNKLNMAGFLAGI